MPCAIPMSWPGVRVRAMQAVERSGPFALHFDFQQNSKTDPLPGEHEEAEFLASSVQAFNKFILPRSQVSDGHILH